MVAQAGSLPDVIKSERSGGILLISDDLRRAERLVRGFGSAAVFRVHDLYEDDLPEGRPETIVSDVESLTSQAIIRLRQILKEVRQVSVPYLFLVHGNAARAEAQAHALGASATLNATAAAGMLLGRLGQLRGRSQQVSPLAEKRTLEARQFLKDAFFSRRPITPTLIESGTDFVEKAVRETGIRDWVHTVQRFDDVTHQHILLVAGLASAFAESLGLGHADRHRLTQAALLHDVGKTQIPVTILNKPGKLDDAETIMMRTHAVAGYTLLASQGFDDLMLAVARSHHEMLDGTGYPDKLKSAEIPDLVRLVTVCDIYAALIEQRPYKQPMDGTKALRILEQMAGKLDGDLVRAFQPIAATFGEGPERTSHAA